MSNERIAVMARKIVKKMIFGFLLTISVVMMASSVWAQTAAPSAPVPQKAKTPSTSKAVSSPAVSRAQVIETQVTENNVFDLEDLEEEKAAPAPRAKTAGQFTEEEKQFIRMNQSLKNLIEENKALSKQKEGLQKDIEDLRGERIIQETRLRALANERADLIKRSEEINNIKASYEKEIEVLKKELDTAKQAPEQSTSDDEQDWMAEESPKDVLAPSTEVFSAPAKPVSGMASELGSLMEENAILRKDTIKLHYNLANLFFEQGKYELAAAEYRRVADLMPQDAATHYNLAFVSAEYLKDYKTAIRHYKRYLMLDPQADDATFVKNQILKLQLNLRNQTNSYIDKDTGDFDLLQK